MLLMEDNVKEHLANEEWSKAWLVGAKNNSLLIFSKLINSLGIVERNGAISVRNGMSLPLRQQGRPSSNFIRDLAQILLDSKGICKRPNNNTKCLFFFSLTQLICCFDVRSHLIPCSNLSTLDNAQTTLKKKTIQST